MTSTWMRGAEDRRRARYTADRANLRVSDTERSEVADRLAQHYGDGRLDQAEFDERMSRAMSAKTWADLDGLFADLPDLGPRGRSGSQATAGMPASPPAVRPAAGRSRHRVLPLVLLVLLTVVAWRLVVHGWWAGFFWPGMPWLWIALLVFCWLRWGPRRHHR